MKWTAADIPSQTGRIAVVTGANSGLGLATARELARAGAHVILACRDIQKGERAQATIGLPNTEVVALDLADLESVRTCAANVVAQQPQIHTLINNAGVMAPPRRLTKDGFESQIGTNHLGHFALTGLLLGALLAAEEPRVVTVASGMHRAGWMRFDDLMSERHYNNWLAYGQSKLANLLFCFELQRRASAAGTELRSVAAHPGYAATNLQFAGPARSYERALMAVGNRLIAQGPDMGALPSLYAATANIPGGLYAGPDRFMETRGHPKVVTAAKRAYDEEAARRLWAMSEELTGVRYDFGAAS